MLNQPFKIVPLCLKLVLALQAFPGLIFYDFIKFNLDIAENFFLYWYNHFVMAFGTTN